MAGAIRNVQGIVTHLQLWEGELCEQLDCTAGQLRTWYRLIPPAGTAQHPQRETQEPYYIVSKEDLTRATQHASILRSGMTVEHILELQARDAQLVTLGKKPSYLNMYALLAKDCPPGITAHALRTYSVVLTYQNRGGRMLMAKELAPLASITYEAAKNHLRYLQAVGLLKLAQNPLRWEFSMVPQAMGGGGIADRDPTKAERHVDDGLNIPTHSETGQY